MIVLLDRRLGRLKNRPFKPLQTDTLAHTLVGAFDVGTNECECMPLLIVAVSLGGTPCATSLD